MKANAHVQHAIRDTLGHEPSPNCATDRISVIHGCTNVVQVKKGNMMKRLQVLPLILGLCFAFTAGAVNAQSAGDKAGASVTRDQVKTERAEFFRTHEYESDIDNWILKPGMEPPGSTKTRAQAKAERDEFFKTHKYDNANDTWVDLPGAPRDISKLTRAQVKAETKLFFQTHHYDAVSDTWPENKASGKKK